MGTLVLILLTLTSLFLMFIILLQRGRGGGLAGALGGAGGQSAFGTKAGDVFTRITIGVAIIWVVLSCLAIYVAAPPDLYRGVDAVGDAATPAVTAPTDEDAAAGAEADQPAGDADAPAGDAGEDKIDVEAVEDSQSPAGEAPATDGDAAPPEDNKE